MRHPLCSLLQRAFYLLPAAFLLCSCVDSSVDYDDIDMKMKFNVDGLKVKFGDTEKSNSTISSNRRAISKPTATGCTISWNKDKHTLILR